MRSPTPAGGGQVEKGGVFAGTLTSRTTFTSAPAGEGKERAQARKETDEALRCCLVMDGLGLQWGSPSHTVTARQPP